MGFDEALERFGFVGATGRTPRGVQVYEAKPNPYLTYTLQRFDDGTALFTWEFAIADYLLEHGMQLGSPETLNLFMFPANDERGPQDGAWVVSVLDRAEAQLAGLTFADADS